jgi:hypothetical protein
MVNTNSSVLISEIYQSRKIILELMDNQGYDTTGYSKFSMNEVNSMKQNNQLDMLLETKSDASESKKIYIRFYLANTIRPSNINEMIEDLFILTETLKKSDTLYIIIKDDTNETLINELKHIWEKDGIFIIIENIKRLQFNILKHVLVPQHKVINKDQVREVMIRYNITDFNQIPDISRFDPVARAIGLRPGDVCHIIRPSKTSIKTNYYRICV